MKRFLLYVFVILLFISVSKDLTENKQDSVEYKEIVAPHHTNTDFTIMHIKIKPGDTVLSIVEEINDHNIQKLDAKQIIADFQSINPNADPYHIQPHLFYYFPKYKK